MEIRLHTFEFGPHKGGLNQMSQRFGFTRPVSRAIAVLRGYKVAFVDDDHEFGQLTVQLASEINNATPDGPEVVVTGTLGLRDFSGSWDDRYSGTIDLCLIAETNRVIDPPTGIGPEIEPPTEG
jgi:hypothetical protein